MTKEVAPNSYADRGIALPSVKALDVPVARRMRADSSSTGNISTNTFNFSTPPPDSVNSGMGNYFESLRVSKDRSLIPYAMVHLRPQILRLLNGLNRKLLAAIGRYLVDNNGVASYAVNMVANYSTPVHPHSACGDPAIGKQYEDFWAQWEKRCDFTRRFTLDELQFMASIAIDVDGDSGATVVEQNGFPQVRFFDTFHIGTLTGLDPKDGVVVDDYGVLQGYRVVDGPVETLQSIANTFIPANQFFLLRDAARYDNYRGFSPMRRGSNDLRDEADIKAFLKLQEKIRSALGGVIQNNGSLEEDVWGDDTGPQGGIADVNSDPNAIPQEKKISLWEMLGGDFPVIEGELKLLDTKLPGVSGIDFLNFLAGQFVAGLGLPPAFFLDERLTGPNQRAVIGKAQRKFDKRKQVLARFIEFLWLRVIGWGIDKKLLPAVPNWWSIGFQYPPLMTIDLGDVMNNERADVLCGQMSERERFANRGKDWDREHDQVEQEIRTKIQSAVKLQEEFKSAAIPIEVILARMGFGTLAMRAVFDAANGEAANNQQQQKPEQKKPAK